MLPQLYHAHHSRHLEDLPFWLSLADETGGPVLELGCGTGRVLIPIAETGLQTVGLDQNLEMLKYVKTNTKPGEMHEPLLICADICRFHLASFFPLIILPCNTFSTLAGSQRKDCLECVCEHLTEAGTFAVSIPNPEILANLPARSPSEIEDEFYSPQTGNPVQVSSSWKRTRRSFDLTWTYDHLLPDGTMEHMNVTTIHYLTSIETYNREIENAGMAVRDIYGDYNLSDYHSDSPYVIFLVSHHSY